MEKNSTKIDGASAPEADNHIEDPVNNTPIHSRTSTVEINEYYSPLFSQCTREESDNIDVMWDWYSPQSKPRVRKQKRIHQQQSPKLPIKRQPSNNQIAIFDKLREDLETLRDQINTKHTETRNLNHKETKHQPNLSDLEDVFNDSMDEQLIRCSQEVENKVTGVSSNQKVVQDIDNNLPLEKHVQILDTYGSEAVNKSNNYSILNKIDSCTRNFRNINEAQNSIDRIVLNYLDTNENKIADDSFDCLLETLKDEDLPLGSKVPTNPTNKPTCSNIQNKEKDESPIKCSAEEIEKKRKEALAKLETKKKNIFENESPINCSPEEIEKKRKEALAKLETKKKNIFENESPIKCSPEEIEKKRLQALAKLEAKRQQEIIEQKRQEALKRLEKSKKRRALEAQTAPCKIIYNNNYK